MSGSEFKISEDTRPVLLTIDDPEVEALIAELVAMTGNTAEGVVLDALRERHQLLLRRHADNAR